MDVGLILNHINTDIFLLYLFIVLFSFIMNLAQKNFIPLLEAQNDVKWGQNRNHRMMKIFSIFLDYLLDI